MAVLICGGTGYIGSHVNKQLHKEWDETIVFDNLVYGHRDAVKWGRSVNEAGTSVLEVIEAVRRVTGRDFPVTLAERRPGDPAVLVGNSEKAKRVLGWRPEYTDIDTIIRHAWVWHEQKAGVL